MTLERKADKFQTKTFNSLINIEHPENPRALSGYFC